MDRHADKPYTLTFELRPDYLYARVEAKTITIASALGYLADVADKCRRTGRTKLLLERDIPVMLESADLSLTTKEFSKMTDGVRVAFVNPHAGNTRDFDFAIVVGEKRGSHFSLHQTVAEAEAWLAAVPA